VVTNIETAAAPVASETAGASVRPLPRLLFAPVQIGALVFFRVAFGLLLIVDLCRYTFGGTIQQNWIDPQIHFTYFGFSWVHPLPGNWMYLHVAALFLGAIGITVGFYYRLSAVVFAVGFTWLFLIEQSNYLNHFYLIALLSWVAVFLPAHRALSLDARRCPNIASDVAPAWTLQLLRAQVAIVYFFGGIAKLNHDWLRGEPVRTWLHTGRLGENVPDAFRNDLVAYLISYGGLAFDLLIVPLLIWQRTRLLALGLAVAFHLLNAFLFNIGIFPFLGIALTLLFLPADWHSKLLQLRSQRIDDKPYWRVGHAIPVLLGIFLTVQLLLPMRHWLYGGNVHWTEEGHRFSWHMMLRSKRGPAHYIVEDHRAKQLWRIDPQRSLSPRQYGKMTSHPEMLLQFAKHIRSTWSHPEIAVYAVVPSAFNGRAPALLIDPEADLARVNYGWRAADWILQPENKRAAPNRYATAEFIDLPTAAKLAGAR